MVIAVHHYSTQEGLSKCGYPGWSCTLCYYYQCYLMLLYIANVMNNQIDGDVRPHKKACL